MNPIRWIKRKLSNLWRRVMNAVVKRILSKRPVGVARLIVGTIGKTFDKAGVQPVLAGETIIKIADVLTGSLPVYRDADEQDRVEGGVDVARELLDYVGLAGEEATLAPVLREVGTRLGTRVAGP